MEFYAERACHWSDPCNALVGGRDLGFAADSRASVPLLQDPPLHGQFGRGATADLRGDIIAGGVLLMAREVEGFDEACGFVVRIDGLNGGADGGGRCWAGPRRSSALNEAQR